MCIVCGVCVCGIYEVCGCMWCVYVICMVCVWYLCMCECICALFVFGIKTENDFDQLKQKHELYFQSGIPDKKQKRAIRNEIAVPGIISVFYGLGVSFVFIAEKIYLKNMERFWNVRYVLELLVLFGVIIFIFGLVIVVFAVSHCRRIRRGLKDEP